MGSSSAAMTSDKSHKPIFDGEWQRNAAGQVMTVYCDCGHPVFYRGAIHARLVVPENGTALCKQCRSMVRVPVIFADTIKPSDSVSG